jgi:hypothetical protein
MVALIRVHFGEEHAEYLMIVEQCGKSREQPCRIDLRRSRQFQRRKFESSSTARAGRQRLELRLTLKEHNPIEAG